MSSMVGQPITAQSVKKRLISLMSSIKGKKRTSFSDICTTIMKDTVYSKILQARKIVVFNNDDGVWEWGNIDITDKLAQELVDEKNRLLRLKRGNFIKSSSTGKVAQEKRSYVRNSAKLYLTVFEWTGPITKKTLYEFIESLNRAGSKLSVVETSYPTVGLEIRSIK